MHLIQATSNQATARVKDTYAAWGNMLTPAQYAERERALHTTVWASERMTTWFLLDEEDNILSSMETYQMESHLHNVAGVSFGVASLFTAEAFRGKAYAQEIVARVMAKLRETIPNLQSFFVFSDVGAPRFEAQGFALCPHQDLVLPAMRCSIAPGIEFFTDTQIPSLSPAVGEFSLVPTPEQITWHITRERFYECALKRPASPYRGARLGDALMLWYVEHRERLLEVLYLSAPTAEQARTLLQVAMTKAQELQLTAVHVWTSEAFDAGQGLDLGGHIEERAEKLAMIAGPNAGQWSAIARLFWL